MKRALILAVAGLVSAQALQGCAEQNTAQEPAAETPAVEIPADLIARHDFSLADTPNKRTALAYLYSAWNDGNIAEARETYWVPGSVFAPPPMGPRPPGQPENAGSPQYTIKKVIEEDDHVVVLALVKGVGIGEEITTIFGTSDGIKIGDAVVEIMRFDENGLIAEKWDTIQPVSEASYDFR